MPTAWLADDFAFDLPPGLIAKRPAERRDGARLLVVHRAERRWEHRLVRDLPEYLLPGDVWVFNDSKVIPARLVSTSGDEELLLLEETSPGHWLCLASPGKRTRAGARFDFLSRDGSGRVAAEVLRTLDTGERVVRFHGNFDPEAFGEMPLPPYILKARGGDGVEAADRERYQTVYAREPGSVAAPTAGLHFTPELLEQFPRAFVTLHVGLGTFRPMKSQYVDDHEMHAERFSLGEEAAARLREARRRVVVGTTTVRVLESLSDLRAGAGSTSIFIRPGYTFRHVDALLTNFHLPKSTLFVLVCAFAGDVEFMKGVYNEAVANEYRFFSYGDAMLIL